MDQGKNRLRCQAGLGATRLQIETLKITTLRCGSVVVMISSRPEA
jgi:hypothetical protein